MVTPPTSAEWTLEGIRFVASILYVFAGAIVLKRHVKPDARLAQYGFVTWWFGIAFLSFFTIPSNLGVNWAELGLNAVRAVVYTLFPVIYIAIGGLLFYLLYIYTGRRGLWRPVVWYVLALCLLTVYVVEGFGPHVAFDETGERTIEYATEHPGWLIALFSFGIVLPPFGAAIAYGMLFFRLKQPTQRYRVAMVTTAIVLWFGYSLFNTVLRFTTNTEGQTIGQQIIGQSLGLVAAVLVLLAYRPPAAIRRRLGAPRGTPA